MLNLFVTLLLLFGGITASDICNTPSPPCRPPGYRIPSEFPETKEEYQQFCTSFTEALECLIGHREACYPEHQETIQEMRQFLDILREICSEDTVLYAAIVDNLKCIKKILSDTDAMMCHTQRGDADLESVVESLLEKGLISLTDNENDTQTLYACMEELNFLACNSLIFERRCGDMAMHAFTEIAMKTTRALYGGCRHVVDLLPEMIHLLKREEDKEKSIAEVFRITASDICNDPSPPCRPLEIDLVQDFPETEEQLQRVCTSAIGHYECSIEYKKICFPERQEDIQDELNILDVFQKACYEDTILHAAIVDNLQCIKQIWNDQVQDVNERCTIQGEDIDRLERFVEGLGEEGLEALNVNTNDTHRRYECIELLNFFACQSLTFERRCGSDSMNAYLKIMQKVLPVSFKSCGHVVDLLPAMIRLRRLEEEAEKKIAEVFRKRK